MWTDRHRMLHVDYLGEGGIGEGKRWGKSDYSSLYTILHCLWCFKTHVLFVMKHQKVLKS